MREFVDQDVVVDGDLVTARTGKHCYLLARQIIEMLSSTDDFHADSQSALPASRDFAVAT